jgi:hypothetical protein
VVIALAGKRVDAPDHKSGLPYALTVLNEARRYLEELRPVARGVRETLVHRAP